MKNQKTWRRRQTQLLAAAVCAFVVAAGCGSTRSDDGISSEAQGPAPTAAEAPAASPSAEQTDPAPAPSTDASAQTPNPASPASPVPASPGATPRAGSSAATPTTGPTTAKAGGTKTQTPAAGNQPGAGKQSSAATPGPKAATPVAPGQPAPATPAAPGSKSEIVLGVLGTQSGVVGEILDAIPQGARAWAADVNARGGINGHPVRLVIADDGGEPAKAGALARRMVDQDKVVAFFNGHGTATFQSVMPFLEERKIPLIGDCSCAVAISSSPMAFNPGVGANLGAGWAQFAGLPEFYPDKKEIGILYCRESPTCPQMRDRVKHYAQLTGRKVVYEAQVSLVQPDYTAEVLAARNAGATALSLIMEDNSVIRLIKSGKRQGYTPQIVIQFTGLSENFLKSGGQDIENVLVNAQHPHWDEPMMAEYKTAMRRVSGVEISDFSIGAWVAGKLVEFLGRSFGGAVTSADFLKGLYALRGETLGGKMPAKTFLEGKANETPCVISYVVKSGKFVAKDGTNYHCAPDHTPPKK